MKTMENSRLVNREFEMVDKYPKRVLVFVVMMCFITLAITPCMIFIPTTSYLKVTAIIYVILAIVDTAVMYVLVTSYRIRRRFPVNFLLAMLHSACLTVLTEVTFIGGDYKWVLVVMAVAVVLYIICTSIGANMKSEIKVGSLGMMISYAVISAAIAGATLAVYFWTDYYKWSLMILAAGITILVIPIALFIAQITLGPREFRGFDSDYCMASLSLHVTLIIFLITLSIGILEVPERRLPGPSMGLLEPIS